MRLDPSVMDPVKLLFGNEKLPGRRPESLQHAYFVNESLVSVGNDAFEASSGVKALVMDSPCLSREGCERISKVT